MNESGPYYRALEFHSSLQSEIDEAAASGSPEADTLRKYYSGIASSRRLRSFYEHNWADRLRSAVELIDRPGMRVLDAGCGTGTESLFFSALGCSVTGVDLNSARIAAARWRASRSQDGRKGSVDFVEGDVAGLESKGGFDMVWSMESVSHIEPLDGFIETARGMLGRGGRLVVSDTNGLNPWFQILAFRQRGFKVYDYVEDETTGCMVRYANERLVPVISLERMLRRAGFTIEKRWMSGFLPAGIFLKAGPRGAMRIERAIRQMPVLPLFGGVFTLVAVL